MSGEPLRWFVPTWYGDIRLTRLGSRRTRVEMTRLTRAELAAVEVLRRRSLRKGRLLRRPWATEESWRSARLEAFGSEESCVELRAPIGRVAQLLTENLRGGRETISVVITEGDRLYEIRAGKTEEEEAVEDNVIPFRRLAAGEPERAVAAVSVSKPVLGCPAPDFARAHVRATEVLRVFLTPEQVEDFERYQRFLTVGGHSGHRYMITSRHARSELDRYHRTVYDVDAETALCVHDWSVPAAEEMLADHLLLSLSQWENHIRSLPDLDVTPPVPVLAYTSDGVVGECSPPRCPLPSLVLTEDGTLGIVR